MRYMFCFFWGLWLLCRHVALVCVFVFLCDKCCQQISAQVDRYAFHSKTVECGSMREIDLRELEM